MSRRAIAISIGVVLLICVVAGIWFLLIREEPPETATVERGSIAVTIESFGRLIPRELTPVRAEISGEIEIVAVEPGDQVDPGDVVMQLHIEPFDRLVEQAIEELELAELQLALVEEEAGDSSEETVERILAQQRVRDAEKAVAAAKQNRERSMILAPTSGTVLSVTGTKGSSIAEGNQIAQIANLQKMDARVELDEIDIPRVSLGVDAVVITEAYPGTEFEGTIQSISPEAQTSGGSTFFPTIVRFDHPPELRLRPGMNADVSIQTAVRDNVLVIPESAVISVGRRTFVDVYQDGEIVRREVRLGLRRDHMTEVISGLEEGERIIIQGR